jgi:hypothetical protein
MPRSFGMSHPIQPAINFFLSLNTDRFPSGDLFFYRIHMYGLPYRLTVMGDPLGRALLDGYLVYRRDTLRVPTLRYPFHGLPYFLTAVGQAMGRIIGDVEIKNLRPIGRRWKHTSKI